MRKYKSSAKIITIDFYPVLPQIASNATETLMKIRERHTNLMVAIMLFVGNV
jgi:hypothetical protein